MKRGSFKKTILITGGAGFIGSHLVRHLVKRYPDYMIINLDKLTYAGNLSNLKDVEHCANYRFVRGDIVDQPFVSDLFDQIPLDGVIHLAAESHVDRSIVSPDDFIRTNITGTFNLLHAAKTHWHGTTGGKLFYHVSTDEVYGTLGPEGSFTEQSPYDPRSPYSASKASSDHLVRAYFHTYGLPVTLSNCSNNFGPFQFPEKLIPLVINNIRNMKPIPVYGKGENVRDWLYVEDHVAAIDLLFHQGRRGQTYNIGGGNEWRNIDLVRLICRLSDGILGRTPGSSEKLITFVTDRPGHDLRYAIDAGKLRKELGWSPAREFEKALDATIRWYLENDEWLNSVTSGEYQKYYTEQYSGLKKDSSGE
ncbi:MAG: dTDP-glucose 4,6-dehydratase [Bacteroidales bacterium]|nr:dTDP-glucose 4,6-dehydratase [Bacteroidales bacterium]